MAEPSVIYNPDAAIPEKVSVASAVDGDPGCMAFAIKGEDHTLGNSLRYMVMKNADVQLCGYSIPHPSDHKFNIRIQTVPGAGVTALDALERGLDDLTALGEHVEATLDAAVSSFHGAGAQE